MDRIAVGRRIRAGRAERGWSQEQFAAIVGINPSTVSALERGYRGMSFDIAYNIARAFGWPLDNLVVQKTLPTEHISASPYPLRTGLEGEQ